jgi:hypothetical protein
MSAAKPKGEETARAPEGDEAAPLVLPTQHGRKKTPAELEAEAFANLVGDGWVESEPGIYYRVENLTGAS